MQNMSFAETKGPFRDQTKDVTRRLRWLKLKAGDRVRAVEKCQGLKRGEKVKPLGVIEIVSVRRERLKAITQDDVRREGFPDMTVADFVRMFCRVNPSCDRNTMITRIEFKYVDSEVTECFTNGKKRRRRVHVVA